MLCYTDSSALKTIYGRHNPVTEGFSEMSKNRFEYQKSANGSENLLGAIGQDDHSRFQKLFTHAFSERGMREMQPRIQGFVDLMIQGMKEAACPNHADMLKWYNWTTFDLIGDLAFGESFHCLETKSTHPWIAVLLGNLKTLGFRMVMLLYGLDWLLPYLTPKRLLEHRTTNMRYTREKMAKRMEKGKGQGDFFDKAIAQSDFTKGTGMTRDEMDSNAASLVLAGSETTATLLTGVTFLLCKHPDILEKLNEEVRSTFAREEDIDLMSVGKLEYMLAVLDEALRIYPPAPNTGARIVPPQGYMVAGKWVPGGVSTRLLAATAN
jgi:averantin hydroxylase